MSQDELQDRIVEAINSLFYNWGCDAPDEVIWGLNKLIDVFKDCGLEAEPFLEWDEPNAPEEGVLAYNEDQLKKLAKFLAEKIQCEGNE